MKNQLREVARRARLALYARKQFEAAILDARAAGLSLRDIADAAGVSHETVRKIAP